jgi:hypothetical protein
MAMKLFGLFGAIRAIRCQTPQLPNSPKPSVVEANLIAVLQEEKTLCRVL